MDYAKYVILNGGYNGGGKTNAHGTRYASGGAGAASITTTNRGVLANFNQYKDEVVAVACGGGGVHYYSTLDDFKSNAAKGGGVNYSATSCQASCFTHHCVGYDNT